MNSHSMDSMQINCHILLSIRAVCHHSNWNKTTTFSKMFGDFFFESILWTVFKLERFYEVFLNPLVKWDHFFLVTIFCLKHGMFSINCALTKKTYAPVHGHCVRGWVKSQFLRLIRKLVLQISLSFYYMYISMKYIVFVGKKILNLLVKCTSKGIGLKEDNSQV